MNNKEYGDLVKILNTYFKPEDLELLNNYYEYAVELYEDMNRMTGEKYIYHSINVAYSLAELKMDKITIGSALIHEAITLEKADYEKIKNKFGEETADILLNISKISGLKRTFKNDKTLERYRKIIVGLADNPKVIFIKLADRLDNLKTLKVHPKDHQQEIIEETEKIFIPIAHRLGIKKYKSELEDLCLRISHPDEYQEILSKLKESKEELEKSLYEMKNNITELLNEHGIKFTITSRVKSVRGVYNKLQSGKKWDSIYDMLGIRVLVDKIEECYLVIGLIHSKFRSLPNRFKDYIANPKSNMYQSLHTTIFGLNNHIYEIQVRTYDMNEIAESGVASHWSYKEHIDGSVKSSLDTRLEEFKALIELNNIEGNLNFFKNLNSELIKEEIYVFTPKGDVIELPSGSTPIDFAYRIHTEVGNTTTGALVNNKMVKLDHKLEDGDIVSLITQNGKGPNKAWLKIVKTESAKARIKSYFFKKEKEKIVETGKELIELEIKKRNVNLNDTLSNENINRTLEELKLDSLEDLYFAVSTLKFTSVMVVNKLLNIKLENKKEDLLQKMKSNQINKNRNDILISGTDNILTTIASCCNPVKGEEIVGYITKGNGVSIHKKDCYNVNLEGERIVDVSWAENSDVKYEAYLNIYIDTDNDKLINIITLASKYDINIDSLTLKDLNDKHYELICKVKNIEDLNMYINDLKGLKFINDVERTYLK